MVVTEDVSHAPTSWLKVLAWENIPFMFSTDLAFLQDFYRRINEEGTAMMKVSCPECGHKFEIDTGGGVGES